MSCNMPAQHLQAYCTSCAMHRVIQHNDVYCMLVYITMWHAYMQKIICYAGFKNSKHLHMNLKLRASCTWSEVKPSSSSSSCSWKSQHTWKSRVDRSWRTAAMTIHDTMNTDTCQRRDEHEVFEDEVFMIDNTKVIRSLAGIITWYHWYPVMMKGSHVDVKVSSYKHLQPNTSTYLAVAAAREPRHPPLFVRWHPPVASWVLLLLAQYHPSKAGCGYEPRSPGDHWNLLGTPTGLGDFTQWPIKA